MTSPVRDSDSRNVYLAAGSFLDVSAERLVDIAGGLDGCAGIGLRLSGEHAIDSAGQARDIRSRLNESDARVFDAEVVRVTSGFDPRTAVPLMGRASEVGAGHVLAVSDLGESGGRSALDESIGVFAALRDLARENGLDVAVEYMAWTTPCDVDDALRVHAETGCRIVVDLLHHSRIGATVAGLESLVRADAIAWVQVCDAPALFEAESLLHEARHGRLIPGEGGLPLRDYLAVIPSHVDISIEVQSDRLLAVEPHERARRLLDATLGLVNPTL
ncbi:MAG: TIM barrel protein [Actinobacteria bacterium]|nr:TIM barrel protein [Actinomycetota bacterium]